MLTDREKFIAHYLSVAIVAAFNNHASGGMDRLVGELRETRTRSITFEEGQKILDELDQEFLLAHLHLIDSTRKKNNPALRFSREDDDLEGLK